MIYIILAACAIVAYEVIEGYLEKTQAEADYLRRRGGTEYINEIKTSSKATRLMGESKGARP